MNDKLPFEDAFERQMNNMQAPLENESWQKMKALLEEKKKRRPFAFFKFQRILGVTLLVTLLSTGIVIYYRNTSKKEVTSSNNKSTAPGTKPGKPLETTQTSDAGNRLNKLSKEDDSSALNNKKYVTATTNRNETKTNKSKKTITTITAVSGKSSAATKGNNKINTAINSVNSTKPKIVNDRFKNKQTNEKVLQTKHEFDIAAGNIKRRNKVRAGKEIPLLQGAAKVKGNEDVVRTTSENKQFHPGVDGIKSDVKPPGTTSRDMETISIINTPNINTPKDLKPNTIAPFQTLTLPQSTRLKDTTNIAKAAELKKTGSRPRKFFVAAGFGIQQQVPFGGQKAAGYNYNGNKNIVTDYIPSVYVQLEKNGHWFLQGEFSYAAPQLVKPFPYQQQTTQNFAAGAYTIHSAAIKKTFYNKVPVSFNYYMLPRLSIGAGAVYSWLHSAVAETQTITKDVTTQQQTITSQLVTMKGYKDSFLYRSHTHLLFQTSYSIKRFSFALSFTKGLQPYIRYTLPDGTVFKEKNWSLDFAFRLRLYQSRNFSLLGKKNK